MHRARESSKIRGTRKSKMEYHPVRGAKEESAAVTYHIVSKPAPRSHKYLKPLDAGFHAAGACLEEVEVDEARIL